MKRAIVLFTISLIALTIGFTALTVTNIVTLPYKAYYNFMSSDAKTQVECLAQNIYYEAGYEPEKGQLAVAFVTINRVKSGHFEDDICGVVKQKFKGVCQFTWYCENTTRSLTGRAEVVYNDVKDLAVYVYANYDKLEDPSKGALFYHADYVNPKWKNMEHLTTIGRHIFYIRKDLKWTS
jgi:spore germination cell wall hydrolase CwlJ-like protein